MNGHHINQENEIKITSCRTWNSPVGFLVIILLSLDLLLMSPPHPSVFPNMIYDLIENHEVYLYLHIKESDIYILLKIAFAGSYRE